MSFRQPELCDAGLILLAFEVESSHFDFKRQHYERHASQHSQVIVCWS